MRLLLIALITLPLLAQRTAPLEPVKNAPVIREAPDAALSKTDRLDLVKVDAAWVTAIKRPARQADRDSRRALRMWHCASRRGGLLIGQRATYLSDRGVTWYVSAAPSFGVVAVRNDRLLTELGCSPVWKNGRHDKREMQAYFADLIDAGTVQVLKAVPDRWMPVEVGP